MYKYCMQIYDLLVAVTQLSLCLMTFGSAVCWQKDVYYRVFSRDVTAAMLVSFPFVLVEKHNHWSREWKYSMWSFEETKWVVAISFICSITQLPLENTLSGRFREYFRQFEQVNTFKEATTNGAK